MNIEQYLKIIFEDMRECTAQIATDREAFFRQFPFMPPSISMGDGKLIFVSNKSVAAIGKIAQIYRQNSVECRRALPENEMRKFVSHGIGAVIGALVPAGTADFSIPVDPKAFWILLRERLSLNLAAMNCELRLTYSAHG